MFVLFLYLFLSFLTLILSIFDDLFVESSIFYSAPKINIQFANITLGISSPANKARGTFAYESYAGSIVAAICQADQINQKLYKEIDFTGTINIAVENYLAEDDVGQYATLQLEKNNFYNRTTGEKLSNQNISNLAGYIGILSSGRNRINSLATSGFAVPFVNPGTLDILDPVDNYVIYSEVENRTYFTVRDTIIYSTLNVVIDLMAAYNWTLGANIYQNNALGFTAQQAIQFYQNIYSVPIFTCNVIITMEDFFGSKFFNDFCSCVTAINSLNVITLWAAPPVSYGIIKKLKKYCSAAKNFVFIVTGETQTLPRIINEDTENFKSVFIIRPFGPWNFLSYVDNCLKTGTEQAKKAVKTLINDYYLQIYNCIQLVDDLTNDTPFCTEEIRNRSTPCICTGLEVNPLNNSYSSQNFFTADSVSMYANVIALLQQNCSFVNELLKERTDKIVSNLDFCELKNFTPAILTGLLVLTNFTGYTGPISFIPGFINIRSEKTFYLYNVHTTVPEAVFVGTFSAQGVSLNYSKVLLPNGNDTISELVAQNPSIKYAAIAVFFGILVFLEIMTFIAFIVLIIYRDHPVIRRNTPFISIVVLVGLFLTGLSGILTCFGVSTATCILYTFFYNVGVSLIIGGIIAKEYRIYRIFTNRSALAVEINDYELLFIVAGITTYFLILSFLPIIADIKAAIKQSSSNPFYLYWFCSLISQAWRIFIILLTELSLAALRIFAIVLAWQTRQVTGFYSESRAVFTVVIIYLCLNIIFIPLFQALKDGTDSAIYKFSIRLVDISITMTSTLVLLFYYRFWIVHKYEKAKKRNDLQILRDGTSLIVENRYSSVERRHT